MFRPPIVVSFREVFFEGYITKNVKTMYKLPPKIILLLGLVDPLR